MKREEEEGKNSKGYLVFFPQKLKASNGVAGRERQRGGGRLTEATGIHKTKGRGFEEPTKGPTKKKKGKQSVQKPTKQRKHPNYNLKTQPILWHDGQRCYHFSCIMDLNRVNRIYCFGSVFIIVIHQKEKNPCNKIQTCLQL